ncbi:MAG: hypothetical protein J6S57_01380 [Alphaproteobacteria bacterium]|nr:hypothetical protein [Alphaproteobacteria bacterium]
MTYGLFRMFDNILCKNGRFLTFINNQYFIKILQKSAVFSRCRLSGKVTYGLTAGPKNVEKFFMSIVCGTEIAGLRIV